MTFNRDPPPSFRGLDFSRPILRYDRHLPHWRQEGATYFVTCCLADSIPANKKHELEFMRREWESKYPPPRNDAAWNELAQTVFRGVERILDSGHGQCWFAQNDYADELWRTLLHFHHQRYEVGCFVIMANHYHMTMRPFPDNDLEKELGAIKRTVARAINEREQLAGSLWQQECYDRILRDEEHLYQVLQYIGRNPYAAGIPRAKWRRWVNPDWEKAGWVFEKIDGY